MQDFLKRTDVQRKTIYEQIALRVGISDPRAIEKDMWVTSLLQVVFGLPYADKFVFKGGSSLSKVWKLIHRFSEDIDLAMDRSLFGLEGDLTKKQLKKLRKESSLFVKEKLASDIAASLRDYGIDTYCEVIPEPDGEGDGTYPEPRKIHIAYKSVFDSGDGYLRPEVLLEVGARSLFEPTSEAFVKSMISENSNIETYVVDNKSYAPFLKRRSWKRHFYFTNFSLLKWGCERIESQGIFMIWNILWLMKESCQQ